MKNFENSLWELINLIHLKDMRIFNDQTLLIEHLEGYMWALGSSIGKKGLRFNASNTKAII